MNEFTAAAYRMADTAAELHIKIGAAYSLFSLMDHAYFTDAADVAVKYMTQDKWEEMQNNFYTLFDMMITARDISKQLQEESGGLSDPLRKGGAK